MFRDGRTFQSPSESFYGTQVVALLHGVECCGGPVSDGVVGGDILQGEVALPVSLLKVRCADLPLCIVSHIVE